MDTLAFVSLVLGTDQTDQDIAKHCEHLTAEDVHNIRKPGTDLSLLPYAAIQDLAHLGEMQHQQQVLLSPLREKEYQLFKQRLTEHLDYLLEQQKQKYNSDDSQMDDTIILSILEKIKTHVLEDHVQLLEYFEYFNQHL